MSYAQFQEDLAVIRYFGPSFRGRFLDLGAFDGKTRSNTLFLAEQGWSGVAVDASWEVVPKVLKAFEKYPVEFLNAAVGVKRGIIEFFDCPQANLSTCSGDLVRRTPTSRKDSRKRNVACVTVGDIIEAFPGPFDFFSIDLEGVTFSVLKSVPFSRLGCRMVCTEHFVKPYVDVDEKPLMEAYMSSIGFKLSEANPSNLLFVRDLK